MARWLLAQSLRQRRGLATLSLVMLAEAFMVAATPGP
jgi:hypothetical protein